MPGAEPPRRKRFQIHLSTAIVLMFVAGGFTWANFVPTRSYSSWINGRELNWKEAWAYNTSAFYGWPFSAVVIFQDVERREGKTVVRFERVDAFNKKELAADIAAAITGMGLAWFVCEWLIRRRASRKGA